MSEYVKIESVSGYETVYVRFVEKEELIDAISEAPIGVRAVAYPKSEVITSEEGVT